MSLLDQVYLPDLEKRNIRNSDSYKLLKDNKLDASILEGYEKEKTHEAFEIPTFNDQADKDKFAEDNANAAASGAKEYLETFGNFLTDETDDLVTSLSLAATNGADVAVNLMPLFYNMMKNTSLGMTMPPEFWSPKTEEQVMSVAQHWSENLGEYRKELFEKQKDNGWVKDILSFVVQDSVYSIPAYNYLRKLGMPKYPAFFLAGAAGAIGVENQDRDGDKTYFDPFAKDIIELKNLIGILPNTPEDKIADEVTQALEYGTFSMAIPAVIDGLKFMKRYIPHFAGGTGASVGLFADNEAEGSPIKSILKAVDSAPMFKSAVVDAADNIPTVASGDQIFNTIKNTTGVKQSELKWMDLEGFLKGKNKVNKDEVLEYINNNRIDVSEVKLSNDAPAPGLSKQLRDLVDDYETRWRDSDLADAVTPNYDKYNINFTNYGSRTDSLDRVIVDDAVNIPQDYTNLSRSPILEGMDNDVELLGTGTPWKNIKALLEQGDWLNKETNKYTGILIRVGKKNSFMPEWTNDLTFIQANGLKTQDFIVTEKQLSNLPNEYTVMTKYEIEPLELERFHLEDEIRNFNKTRMDKGNQPLYERYTEPGGEDYTELVFKTKTKDMTTPAILEGEFGTLANNKVKTTQKTSVDFMSPHFNRPNEFAHVRFKTRELPNGKKALVVEEMQSDLLQASKTNMFQSAKAFKDYDRVADKVLKDFPFKNTWYEFTIKRLSRYAADNGFDAIAIPKGSLAANRYGQKIDKVKSIIVEPFESNKAYDKGDRSIEPGFTIKLLDENAEQIRFKNIVGLPGEDGFFEQFAKDKMLSNNKSLPELQQLVLLADETGVMQQKTFDKIEVVGSGTGKFDLYDKTIPSYMKKYAKKWNAKVYDDVIQIEPTAPMDSIATEKAKFGSKIPVTILELSDGMKKDVVSSSQPLFEIFGTVSLSTWAAKEVSDSMENNIISQTTENMY